jgi:hypothetical protein
LQQRWGARGPRSQSEGGNCELETRGTHAAAGFGFWLSFGARDTARSMRGRVRGVGGHFGGGDGPRGHVFVERKIPHALAFSAQTMSMSEVSEGEPVTVVNPLGGMGDHSEPNAADSVPRSIEAMDVDVEQVPEEDVDLDARRVRLHSISKTEADAMSAKSRRLFPLRPATRSTYLDGVWAANGWKEGGVHREVRHGRLLRRDGGFELADPRVLPDRLLGRIRARGHLCSPALPLQRHFVHHRRDSPRLLGRWKSGLSTAWTLRTGMRPRRFHCSRSSVSRQSAPLFRSCLASTQTLSFRTRFSSGLVSWRAFLPW